MLPHPHDSFESPRNKLFNGNEHPIRKKFWFFRHRIRHLHGHVFHFFHFKHIRSPAHSMSSTAHLPQTWGRDRTPSSTSTFSFSLFHSLSFILSLSCFSSSFLSSYFCLLSVVFSLLSSFFSVVFLLLSSFFFPFSSVFFLFLLSFPLIPLSSRANTPPPYQNLLALLDAPKTNACTIRKRMHQPCAPKTNARTTCFYTAPPPHSTLGGHDHIMKLLLGFSRNPNTIIPTSGLPSPRRRYLPPLGIIRNPWIPVQLSANLRTRSKRKSIVSLRMA